MMVQNSAHKDISVMKLINYNLLFFIPLILLYLISFYFSRALSPQLQLSPEITTEVIMMFLSLILFFVLIPFLRIRESIRGVRFSLFNFLFMGFVITLPGLVQGNYNILMSAIIYLANFVFATFINSPDIIGISGDADDWFKHKVQVMVFVIYVSIVLLYINGFAWIYFQMAHDVNFPNAFNYASDENPNFWTFVYYSVVSMATVGYGDITPNSVGARFVISLQIIIGMIINVVFIAILVMYISFSQSLAQQKLSSKISREEKLLLQEEKRLEKEENRILREEKKIENLEREEEKKLDELNNRGRYSQYNQNYPNYMNGQYNQREMYKK